MIITPMITITKTTMIMNTIITTIMTSKHRRPPGPA
jgi:hypothetical protein